MSANACAICFEDIEVAKTGRTTLSCSHEFHYSCLTRWFISAIDADGDPSCPCCRKQMDGLENYPEYESAEGSDDEDEDEDDDDEEEDEDPTFFTFAQLKAFIRLRGGSSITMRYWLSMRTNLMSMVNQACFASIEELNEVLTDHGATAIAGADYDTWDEHLPFNPYVSQRSLPKSNEVATVHLTSEGAWTTAFANPEEDTGVSVSLPKDEAGAAGTVAHLLAKKIQRTWRRTQPITLEALEMQLMGTA
jgi:hypothetical protein